jgi:hypothetical protein
MDKDCSITIPPKVPKKEFNSHAKGPSSIWVKKQDNLNDEECSLALQAQSRRIDWYVDNGCSKHMTDDKNRFIMPKK